ncbi:MAG: PepSY-associated TM helix domain-containing protein [Acidobacteriota bacterium]
MNKRTLKRLYWQIHSACSIYTGGFLAFILLTGAIAVYAPEIYDWEFREHARLDSSTPLDPEVLWPAVERAANRLRAPGADVNAVPYEIYLPKSDTHTVRVRFINQGFRPQPFVPDQPWILRSVFVHPSSGEILGEADDDSSLSSFVRSVHVRFFAGTPGRNFVGLFGISLLVVSFSGLLILSQYLGKKSLWLVRRTNLRATHSDLHKLLGFVFLLPLLLFAITGFWLGMQGHLMRAFEIERPGAFSREAVLTAEEDPLFPLDVPGALAAAKRAHPKLEVQKVRWSTRGERYVSVQGRTPRMVYERYSQGVVLDKSDLGVLAVSDTASGPWQDKLFYLQEALHFGDFGGAPLKAVYLGIGLVLGLLPLTGYAIARLRARRSFRPFWRWTAVGLAYPAGYLWLLRTHGLIVAASWATAALCLFVLGLSIYWIRKAIRGRRAGGGRGISAARPAAPRRASRLGDGLPG